MKYAVMVKTNKNWIAPVSLRHYNGVYGPHHDTSETTSKEQSRNRMALSTIGVDI